MRGGKLRVRHISYKEIEQEQFDRDKEISKDIKRSMSDTYKLAMRIFDKELQKLSKDAKEMLLS
jgi:hypothetical protein